MARGYRAVLELGEREDALRVDRLSMSGCTTEAVRCGRRVSKPHVTTGVYRFGTLLIIARATWTSS